MAINKRELEIFFGPDYTATIRPVSGDGPARSTAKAVETIPADPWPDQNVFLAAKQQDVLDWAQTTFGPIVARRVKDFLVRGDTRALDTLTVKEIRQLQEKLKNTNEHGAKKATRLENRLK